jgi:hypothetical protein
MHPLSPSHTQRNEESEGSRVAPFERMFDWRECEAIRKGDGLMVKVGRPAGDAPGNDKPAAIFFHYPCFDGLVSAAIAVDFLEGTEGWRFGAYHRVNYDQKEHWLRARLSERSAVVDFLYHPQATFWADHHPTTFLDDQALQQFESDRTRPDRWLLYDRKATSCAVLLIRHLKDKLSEPERFAEMAEWADKIDSANYSSVDEAVFGSAPALDINLALTVEADDQRFCELLLKSLRSLTLTEVSELREIRRRTTIARRRLTSGLKAVERSIRLVDGDIAVFSTNETPSASINRYSPYVFFPNALYSVALVRAKGSFKITAMRNPWLHFESIELGQLFRKYGGGGHQRVASLIIPGRKTRDPHRILQDIVSDMRKQQLTSIAV